MYYCHIKSTKWEVRNVVINALFSGKNVYGAAGKTASLECDYIRGVVVI